MPHDSSPNWLLMLTAYLDESGHETKDLVVVSGYLGNESQWRRFAVDWRVRLGRRKSLHMHSLRWKSLRTKKLLETLGPIPKRCGLRRIVGAVRVKDYEHLVSGSIHARLLRGYLVALQAAIAPALIQIPADERLEVVLENQFQYNREAARTLEQLCTLPPVLMNKMRREDHALLRTKDGLPKLANYKFVPKGTTSLLEPADYLAYAILQNWRDPSSLKARWCRPIFDNEKHFGWVMKKTQVQEFIPLIPKVLGL